MQRDTVAEVLFMLYSQYTGGRSQVNGNLKRYKTEKDQDIRSVQDSDSSKAIILLTHTQ